MKYSENNMDCACSKQILDMLKQTGAQKAVVWRSPYELWADCDSNLSTHVPNKNMRFYPHTSVLGDTEGGQELTNCPAAYAGPFPKLGSDYQVTLKSPYVRYVDQRKIDEPGYQSPGDVRYMSITMAKPPRYPPDNPFC